MIRRDIIDHPDEVLACFDYFNDAEDTIHWLHGFTNDRTEWAAWIKARLETQWYYYKYPQVLMGRVIRVKILGSYWVVVPVEIVVYSPINSAYRCMVLVGEKASQLQIISQANLTEGEVLDVGATWSTGGAAGHIQQLRKANVRLHSGGV